MGLQGKVAIITGGSEGIGYAAAHALAQNGAHVVLVARDAAKLERAVSTLPGSNHFYISADVTKSGEPQRIMDETVAKYRRLDILVNSAGVFAEMPFDQMDASLLERILRLNFEATAQCSLFAIKRMEKDGSPVIVNVSSNASLKRYPNEAAYVTSKIAVNALTEELAREFKGKIAILALAPGSVDTPLLRKELEPRRAELERIFREAGVTMTLDEYFERILTPAQVGEKILDMIVNPKKYGAVTELPSYTF